MNSQKSGAEAEDTKRKRDALAVLENAVKSRDLALIESGLAMNAAVGNNSGREIEYAQRVALQLKQEQAVAELNNVLQQPTLDDAHFAELRAAIAAAETLGVDVVEAKAWLGRLEEQKQAEDAERSKLSSPSSPQRTPPPPPPPANNDASIAAAAASAAAASAAASAAAAKKQKEDEAAATQRVLAEEAARAEERSRQEEQARKEADTRQAVAMKKELENARQKALKEAEEKEKLLKEAEASRLQAEKALRAAEKERQEEQIKKQAEARQADEIRRQLEQARAQAQKEAADKERLRQEAEAENERLRQEAELARLRADEAMRAAEQLRSSELANKEAEARQAADMKRELEAARFAAQREAEEKERLRVEVDEARLRSEIEKERLRREADEMARQLEEAKRAVASADKLKQEAAELVRLKEEEQARSLESSRLSEASRRLYNDERIHALTQQVSSPSPKTEVCHSCKQLLQGQMEELARQMHNDREMYNNMRAERDRVQQMYLRRVEADGQRGGQYLPVDEADLPTYFNNAAAMVVKRIIELETQQRRDSNDIEALRAQVENCDSLNSDKVELEGKVALLEADKARDHTKIHDLEARMAADKWAFTAKLAVVEKERDILRTTNDALVRSYLSISFTLIHTLLLYVFIYVGILVFSCCDDSISSNNFVL